MKSLLGLVKNIELPNLRYKMPLKFNKPKVVKFDQFLQLYREPVITYQITPNNAPEYVPANEDRRMPRGGGGGFRGGRGGEDDFFSNPDKSDALLNVISGLFSKFYLPERVRFEKKGIRIKLNDVVSYKVVFQNESMKFFLTVPKRWAKSFTNAIKRDWGQVDITQVEEGYITFNPSKAKAMNIVLRHHHALAIKHGKGQERVNGDLLYPALASLGATLDKNDKMVLDFNLEPVDESWKNDVVRKQKEFKKGVMPHKEEKNIYGLIGRFFDFANIIFDEAIDLMQSIIGVEKDKDEEKEKEALYQLNYSQPKTHANAKGYKVQIRAIAESIDSSKTKYMLKKLTNAIEELEGDNQFSIRHIRTKRGVKSIIEAVEKNVPQLNKTRDIYFDAEINQFMKMPSKNTLKEYKKVILQDNFTRTEVHEDFLKSDLEAITFARTLDKESKVISFPAYKRDWWTEKGRKAHVKTELDDRSTVTMIWGRQGSGKTELTVREIVETFGIKVFETYSELIKLAKKHRKDGDEEGAKILEAKAEVESIEAIKRWKELSKSVVAFDVADGEILTKVWNLIPKQLRHRVIILNHAVPERPIPINFAELEEFNRKVMHDTDYAFKLAEMESKLIGDIVEAGKSVLATRWLTYALQCAHTASPDYGIPEAIRLLIDDDFRIADIMPKIEHDEELMLHMETYNEMRENGDTHQIVTVIQNRLSLLSSDRKLWDCIAQQPLRDENGDCTINFRKWMDGDEEGAYLVLVYVPKEGVSKQFRKFLFAHYLLKIWNVAVSREKGFAGREYRPETLVVVDEIHQVIDIPTIAELFVDQFKESRKYSIRLFYTLHGWSSIMIAGRDLAKKIKDSIMDNGCNLIMLKGGEDAFESLQNFMGEMTIQDYNNLMNMEFCGIFSIWWKGHHVFQGRLLPPATASFMAHDKWDLHDLAQYVSPYSRDRDIIRKENLQRIRSMMKTAMKTDVSQLPVVPQGDEESWKKAIEESPAKRGEGGREKRFPK